MFSPNKQAPPDHPILLAALAVRCLLSTRVSGVAMIGPAKGGIRDSKMSAQPTTDLTLEIAHLLLIDVVGDHSGFLENLTRAGWSIERPFQRMRFGRAGASGPELPFAVAGPEFG